MIKEKKKKAKSGPQGINTLLFSWRNECCSVKQLENARPDARQRCRMAFLSRTAFQKRSHNRKGAGEGQMDSVIKAIENNGAETFSGR